MTLYVALKLHLADAFAFNETKKKKNAIHLPTVYVHFKSVFVFANEHLNLICNVPVHTSVQLFSTIHQGFW